MEKTKKPLFKRVDWNKKPRFNRRAKRIKWRKATGRDSKIRLSRRGHGVSPGVGYMAPRSLRGKINGRI